MAPRDPLRVPLHTEAEVLPRSLDRLEWKVEKGRLKVNYQDFRPGVADSEVVAT